MDFVDETEILAFAGLMYLRGLADMCNHDVKYLYSALMSPQLFGATMSKNQFHFCTLVFPWIIFLLAKHDGSTTGLRQRGSFLKSSAKTVASTLFSMNTFYWTKLCTQ